MSKESYNPDQLDGISLTIKDFVKVKKVGEDALGDAWLVKESDKYKIIKLINTLNVKKLFKKQTFKQSHKFFFLIAKSV